MWTKISSGFDADEETANFGTRNFAETPGSIYETWTLAVIQPDVEVVENPKVTATVFDTRLCVSVDNSITIFNDLSCNDVLSSIGFDSQVTSYCLSKDSSLLFVSVEPAELHCFTLTDSGQEIFYLDLHQHFQCHRIIKVCLDEQNDLVNLFIVTSVGKIYQINDFNKAVSPNADDDNIIKAIQVLPIHNSKIEYADLKQSSKISVKTLVTLGDDIYLFPANISCPLKSLPYQYIKAQFFKNYSGMICLRADKSLSIVHLNTLIGKKVWDGPVADFVTLQEASDSNHMLVLMDSEPSADTTSLHLMSFPDFKIIFTMTVPRTTYLIDVVGGELIDNLMIIEGMKNSSDLVGAIRVKSIGESLPEYRLQRLLKQQRFDEAREFASKFKLNCECIFQAQLSVLMNQLRPQLDDNETVDLDSFISILDQIKDVKYIYECCSKALTRDYQDTKRLYMYTKKRIFDCINLSSTASITEDHSRLLHEVSDTLKKLETFECIQKVRSEYRSDDFTDINEWDKFSRANLLEECIRYLSLGEVHAAALIWTRHISSIAPRVGRGTVEQILEVIPGNLGPTDLWPWLHQFIPSVTSFIPSSLTEIILWGYKKTKSLEKSHRDQWPAIGLQFLEGLVDLLHFEEYKVCFQLHQQYTNKNSQFHRLMKLMQAVSDLVDLKTHYKVLLPLNTYLSNPIDVVTLLLNKIHIDEIPGLMSNFLNQYMVNHSLKNDEVLSTYIQNTLKNSKQWWIGDKAPWDKRLTVVISYIHNIQNRLQQTLEVLKKAPVPWSDALSTLADQSYKYNHPLVAQIHIESNSITLKLILKKYGFAHIGCNINLYKNIIKQDRADMVEDLFELTKADNNLRQEVIFTCLNYQLCHGNTERFMDTIDKLDGDLLLNCCQQIVDMIKIKLSYNKLDTSLEYYMEVQNTLENKLKEALTSAKNKKYAELNDSHQTLKLLKNIYRLFKEFDIDVDQNKYCLHKKDIIHSYIVKIVSMCEDDTDWLIICKRVERVSGLLGLPKFFGLHEVLQQISPPQKLKDYIIDRLNSAGMSPDPDESRYIIKICSELLLNLDDNSQLAICLKNSCSSTLIHSTEKIESLTENLLLINRIEAYNEAVGAEKMETGLQSPLSFKLYPIYTDASFSPGNILLPLLKDALDICRHYKNISRGKEKALEVDPEVIRYIIKNLFHKVKAVQSEHHDYALLKIFMIIQTELCSYQPVSEEAVKEIKVVMKHCSCMLLKKLVSNRSFDIHLGLACLFLQDKSEVIKILASISKYFQTDPSRDRVIKDLGYEYCRLIKNDSHIDLFNEQRIIHCWAERLGQYGISHQEVLQSNIEGKRNIMIRIMKSKKPEALKVLEDFCCNFGFSLKDCYLKLLETLLLSWQPNYSLTTGKDGKKDLKVDETDIKELENVCKKLIKKIKNVKDSKHSEIKTHLETLKQRVNFYHYEIFLLLLNLGNEKDFELQSYLRFLKNYIRISPPTDIEREEWLNYCQDEHSLPAIAQWRLPYLPKVSIFKLITQELNLKTYEEWLKIAPVLKIANYCICTLAVKGAVAEAWPHNSVTSNNRASSHSHNEWSIHLRNGALLQEIKKCINVCIKQKEEIQYGAAAWYHVVNYTPPGADRVAAAKECFLYAQNWQQQVDDPLAPDDSIKSKLYKIEEKYFKYTSKHTLYTYGLGQDRYLNLVENPEKLVQELYHDETIPARYKGVIKNRPDINAAVTKLGDIFKLNLMKIRLALLHEWLQPEVGDNKANDTLNMFNDFSTLSNSITGDTFTTDDNLLRACYLVGSDNSENYANYLLNISLIEGNDEDYGNLYEPGMRFRALRVLQSIKDEVALADYAKRDPQRVNQYMKSLQYLTELERFGLSYSITNFDMCSKQKLVQILVNSQYSTPRALGLIPQLYLDYDIEDLSYLNTALEYMVKYSLVQELKKNLLKLGSIDRIINFPGYIAAWQLIINEPFNKLDHSSKSIDNCIEALRLLHVCPIIDKLQFSSNINYCFVAKQPHFAASLLPFLNGNEQEIVLQKLLQNLNYEEITSKMLDLASKGVSIVYQSITMLNQARTKISIEQ
ncbi:GSCOCG00003645001-RA-CDS [Cotesia congregata]|uniref:Similar to KNTC1: Kinetochore-associated protein 1 (Homo sapiens) n=1 Tax=Cotesia congregata TaxID=51543 RepID=A0A8J2MTN9_COTCN|nr:GSCOCG00003645001-RA-CDS [Cotesia congregata]CAG5107543.1 Similar to KNTC1: Kinetochore-associated protein 1 (Homo sapiens) [Cotesia congregata]